MRTNRKHGEGMKEHCLMIIWCVIYVLSVNIILSEYYLAGITPVVPYYKSFSILRLLICILIIEALYILTRIFKCDKQFSENIKWLLYIMFVIPMVMSYSLFEQQYSLEFLIYGVTYWIIFLLLLQYCNFRFVLGFNLKAKIGEIVYRILVIGITGILVFFIVKSLGDVSISLSLQDVYTTRAWFKEHGNFTLTVLKAVLGAYVCPCMIVSSFSKRRYFSGIVFMLFEIVMFSLAKDKSYLMLLFMSAVIGIFGNFFICDEDECVPTLSRQTDTSWLSKAYIVLSGLNVLALLDVAQNFIFNVFTRRAFVMPIWLQYVNYEFFYDKPKIWWRQDSFLIHKLFTPVYPQSVTDLIANEYFGGWVGNPNCGLVGEAFNRCGYWGVFIYPFLLVVLIRILEPFFQKMTKRMQFIICFVFSSSILNDVITSTVFVASMLILVIYTTVINRTYYPKDSLVKKSGIEL